jgi:hypothetical protein
VTVSGETAAGAEPIAAQSDISGDASAASAGDAGRLDRSSLGGARPGAAAGMRGTAGAQTRGANASHAGSIGRTGGGGGGGGDSQSGGRFASSPPGSAAIPSAGEHGDTGAPAVPDRWGLPARPPPSSPTVRRHIPEIMREMRRPWDLWFPLGRHAAAVLPRRFLRGGVAPCIVGRRLPVGQKGCARPESRMKL